jgi:hypothetical protein
MDNGECDRSTKVLEKLIWNLALVMGILKICDFKCKMPQISLYVSYGHLNCIHVRDSLCVCICCLACMMIISC